MFARSILIAAAVALGAGSVASAEPAKAPRPESAAPQVPAEPVLMASADVAHGAAAGTAVVAASATEGAAAPAKRPRRGRVTTCRCADTPNQ